MVPIKKVVIANKYIFREPKVLISQAEIGIITPFTNKKAVESHSAVAVLIENDFMIEGKAVASSVPFSTVQNDPIIRTRTNNPRLYGLPWISTGCAELIYFPIPFIKKVTMQLYDVLAPMSNNMTFKLYNITLLLDFFELFCKIESLN